MCGSNLRQVTIVYAQHRDYYFRRYPKHIVTSHIKGQITYGWLNTKDAQWLSKHNLKYIIRLCDSRKKRPGNSQTKQLRSNPEQTDTTEEKNNSECGVAVEWRKDHN